MPTLAAALASVTGDPPPILEQFGGPPAAAQLVRRRPTVTTPSSMTRAADFRARARDALDQAQGSALQQVRERHELAASTWIELARSEDRRTLNLSRRFGRAAQAGFVAPTPRGRPVLPGDRSNEGPFE